MFLLLKKDTQKSFVPNQNDPHMHSATRLKSFRMKSARSNYSS